jgi:hypothetical protein
VKPSGILRAAADVVETDWEPSAFTALVLFVMAPAFEEASVRYDKVRRRHFAGPYDRCPACRDALLEAACLAEEQGQ